MVSYSATNWESGLVPWTAGTSDVAEPASFDTPNWAVAGTLPDWRASSGAPVADRDSGDCESDDQSGVLFLESPAVTFHQDVKVPRIAFTH